MTCARAEEKKGDEFSAFSMSKYETIFATARVHRTLELTARVLPSSTPTNTDNYLLIANSERISMFQPGCHIWHSVYA